MKSAVIAAALVATFAAASTGLAQEYPSKPVRIVTAGVGGSSDFAARVLAQGLTAPLGQTVIVDNRPSGVIPGETVAKAAPDGYTILLAGGTLWTGPLLQPTPYDPVRDFAPITIATLAPNLIVIHPSLPVKSVTELIAFAKARPGELNYSAGGTGGTSHLSAELFKVMAGVNIVHVPYKGGGAALNDLIAGQVHMTIDGLAVLPHVKSGRLRALAVTSLQPSPLAPGLPTVAAGGVPGYEAVTLNGLFAPAKTPAAIVRRLNQEMVRVLQSADTKERFHNAGAETVGSTPEELANRISAEMARWTKVIRTAGIRVN